jgi:hypothetical protein
MHSSLIGPALRLDVPDVLNPSGFWKRNIRFFLIDNPEMVPQCERKSVGTLR